ncbi:MAG: LPS-assembly protein LptD [Herminiimonas sp.]|nr:LPS-assembly protein LptD [Herminiimonas sp.]
MTPSTVSPHIQRLLYVLAAVVAVAALPTFAHAQSPAPSQTVQKRGSAEDRNAPADVSAERMNGRPDRELELERNVEITRGSMRVTSDKATYSIVEDQIKADGNITMRRFGDRYTGDELNLKMDSGEGYVTNPTYRLERNNAQGKASRIDFEGEDRATVSQGTYSTCEGPDPDWYLKADTLKLDSGRDIGIARKTVVYFKGLPILGTPAMSFPLSDARKSGVLPPTFGTTSKGGLEILVPYYFNIAPNRDLTLYPKIITRRGIQLGADARYLGESYYGETRIEGLFNDQQTKTNRYAVTSTHAQTVLPGLSFGWNLNTASDDNYPSDFSHSITNSAQRLLPRDINVNYGSSFWSANARVSNYQVLQDPAAPILRPYDRLPQLTFQAGRQDVAGFDWQIDTEATRFWHPDFVRGDRVVVNPRISYPIIRPGYFVTPRLALHATTYQLQNQAPGVPTDLNRVLPTFSVDGGMVFERDARFFGAPMTQTLEPRLFYVRTPYRDQSKFPLFDTAEADLSFAQLFTENRFVGSDRISDANQLTAALVSRYIEPSGAERLRFALGQRFYFTSPQVTLLANADPSRSDVLASASGQLTSTIGIDGNVQYSESQRRLNRSSYGVRWQPAPKRVLNLQYRRDFFNKLEQVDVSAQWPIANRWYGVGRVNYSLPDSRLAEGLLGMEYKADCWIFRAVAQRTPTATQRSTSSLFFQLELNGLTRLGSNPIDALRTNIPGYQMISQ